MTMIISLDCVVSNNWYPNQKYYLKDHIFQYSRKFLHHKWVILIFEIVRIRC